MSFGPKLSSFLVLALIWILTLIGENEAEAGPTYYSPADAGASNYDQLNAFLKDYINILEKVKTQQPKQISGQVNLRAPRSELVGDMAHALRLYQLAELDRMYGAKSRPRFGKRGGGVSQEFAPASDVSQGGYESSQNDMTDRAEEVRSSATRDDEQRRR